MLLNSRYKKFRNVEENYIFYSNIYSQMYHYLSKNIYLFYFLLFNKNVETWYLFHFRNQKNTCILFQKLKFWQNTTVQQ